MYQCPVCWQTFSHEEDLELHWLFHGQDLDVLTPDNLYEWTQLVRQNALQHLHDAVLDEMYGESATSVQYALENMRQVLELERLEYMRTKANRILRGWEDIPLPPELAAHLI